MPVRIYDISKKLGLDNKEVLSKAKELGIAAARVASSSLDKITAEYLEDLLRKEHPEIAAVPPPQPPAPPPAPNEPILLVTAPPEPPPAPKPELSEPPPEGEAPATAEIPKAETKPAAPAAPPSPPPPPPGPKVGDKVGFIQLPQKPGPKTPDKSGGTKLPARPTDTGRTEFPRRGDIRSVRTLQPPGRATGPGGGRAVTPAARGEPAKPPAAPKFIAPVTGEVITIKPPIVVRDLAEQLKQKPFKVIADLMELGVFANVNQAIDEKIAQQVCAKYGFRFEVEKRERGGGVVHAPVKKVELDI